MHPPIPHDHKTYDGKFDFEKYGFCSNQWEISVPQRNCIIWSVVLSYLRTADFTVPEKFEERLNRLTETKFDSELVKSAILDFNPFYNFHKCFFNETLQNLSLSFKKLLDDNRPSTMQKSVPADLEMISNLLKSNIMIVDFNKKEINLIEPINDCCAELANITLFCREFLVSEKKQVFTKCFTFCLSKDLCWELRSNAFETILRQLRSGPNSSDTRGIIEKEIQAPTHKKEKKINILIALLKKKAIREIYELYDSPHTVAKLANAGFETDPRVPYDNGYSAFYYALQSSDNNIVYLLYKYAVNSCYESENTYRDPNESIISNFPKLEDILKGDCDRSNNFENFGETAEQARLKYEELGVFNKFLTQVSDGINRIRKIYFNGTSMDKHRDIILLVLNTYLSDEYFSIGDSNMGLLENYGKHKTYYDNLDFTVALLFFDNIFLLKSVLRAPRDFSELYSELESSFLSSAVTKNHFTKKLINDMPYLVSEIGSINQHLIPFLERQDLREKIRNFCNILGKKTQHDKDIVERIPQQEIDGMLSYFPVLRDEFLIFRLNHYIRAALETKLEDPKLKFVIQRALQVIGESINVVKEGPSSIRRLLCQCLSDDALRVLKKIRDLLSHLKSWQFPLKFKAEQDDELFTSILSVIRTIAEAFKEVFDIQKVRLMEFMIDRGLKLLKNQATFERNHRHMLFMKFDDFSKVLRQKRLDSEVKLKKNGRRCIIHKDIEEFCRRIMGFASRSEEERIRRKVPEELTDRVQAMEKLVQNLEKEISVNVEEFDCLFFKRKDLCSIKEDYEKFLEDQDASSKSSRKSYLLHKIRKSPNPINILDSIFQKSKVSTSQLDLLFETVQFSDEAKAILNSLTSISRNGDNLENLLNRIERLHEISIDQQYDIRYLRGKVKSFKSKKFLAYKIVQLYFRDSSFQASLEMLLFDCLAILKSKEAETKKEENEDFKSFWLKTSHLFNGIDVRNVLAHGDPLLESIGGMLDPKDFPSELVKKMLQLFEDKESIETLSELWQKARLKDRIVSCERWQEYGSLLTEGSKDTENCNHLMQFLKSKPE